MVAGYVFLPTDEQLINEYLKKKEKELPLPGQAVVERELYGEKSPWEVLNSEEGDRLPWQIFKTRDGKTRKIKYEATIYVLTPLKKASQNRIRRTAGCGKWQENWAQEILNDSDDVIGYKKMLVFMVVDNSVFEGAEEGLIKGHWIMHEYTLKNEKFPFALCKITRDDSKDLKRAPNNARKRNAAVDEEEVSKSQRKGKQICAIAEEYEDNQRGGRQESNSTCTVPYQLHRVESVEQSSSARILQSVLATEPPTSNNAEFRNEFDFPPLMDPSFRCPESNSTFTVPYQLPPVNGVEQSSSASILQSVLATEPPSSYDAAFWNESDFPPLMDPNFRRPESNSIFTVPSQLPPVESVEQSSSASILQSVLATEPPSSYDAAFWNESDFPPLMDPNFRYT